MAIAVCKFGGTSLCDADRFRRVFAIAEQTADRKYIVLSAPGKRTPSDDKITDLFYRAHGAAAPEDRYIFSQIFQRYASIREALDISFDLEAEFRVIWEKLHSSPDYAASRGEYLCAKLFAAYTGYAFIDAADVLCFADSDEINLPRSRKKLIEQTRDIQGKIVIPGFYGTGPDGRIRTFTRGGSDISGAVIAVLADADCYENWTDVDGVYSADPTAIPEAVHHDFVNIYQMHAIANAGAQVLHPKSLEALFGTHICTIIKNSFSPDDSGTSICEAYGETVPCVTGKKGLKWQEIERTLIANGSIVPPEPEHDADERFAIISIFSADFTVFDAVVSILNPITIQYMHNHLRIIIPEKRYDSAIRTIHSILIR